MPRGGVDEARSETVLRRLRTIPPLVFGLLPVTVLFPALLILALIVVLVRRFALGVPPTAMRLA